jgi:hypothetical protein
VQQTHRSEEAAQPGTLTRIEGSADQRPG